MHRGYPASAPHRSQYRPQVGLPIDQYPAGALGPDGPHPAFGIAIRARRPRRRLRHPHTDVREDPVEGSGELGVTVPEEEPERTDPVTKIHQQIPRLPRRPVTVRVLGHPQNVHPPGRHLNYEQHIQPREEDGVHGKEITRRRDVRLGPQELAPGRIHTARRGPVPPGTHDPADRRVADLASEARPFAVHPPVPPPRGSPWPVSTRSRTSWLTAGAAPPTRVGPFPGQQATVSGQQRSRRHQPTSADRNLASSDTARVTIRKTSLKPTSRRSSHAGQARACHSRNRHGTQSTALGGDICAAGTDFRHPQVPIHGHVL
jgi:hypothetical protein